jgi:type VI secretion system protein ImpG
MDRRLLHYYNRELQHLREVGAEFANEYPKIAARLGIEGLEVADPYVERLLESFGFMAARVQMKIDAEFPRFTQHLLEMVYPAYLAPVPSMAIVRFEPEPAEGTLADGVEIARGSALRSVLGKGEQTPCEYRTSQAVTLWPIEIAKVEYMRFAGSAAGADLPALPEIRSGQVKAGIRIRLRTTTGARFDQLALDRLPLHMTGSDGVPVRVLEQLLGNALRVVVRPTTSPAEWHHVVPGDSVRAVGFADDESLLPVSNRRFGGYRLVKEYFAFPQRFLFAELTQLQGAVRRCADPEIDIVVLLDRADPMLDESMDESHFALFCAPAINLFPRRADRIHLSDHDHEYQVLADRTRPMDFEIYDVLEVSGYTEGGARARTFEPFYAVRDVPTEPGSAYFTIRRTPRLMSERQSTRGPRSGYMGSEVFLSIVDAHEAPYRSDLRQLAPEVLCTNRDLPLLLSPGTGKTDFTLVSGAPVRSTRIIAGPTRPRGPMAEGEAAWRLIGHLSLNYLSLSDTDERQGAAAIREMLGLYGDIAEPGVRKQIEGVRSIASRPVLKRIARDGMSSWVRGLAIDLTFDEAAFQGAGVYLLGAVLERFFARYVSINSFTETVARTLDRGEIARWPARIGNRTLL